MEKTKDLVTTIRPRVPGRPMDRRADGRIGKPLAGPGTQTSSIVIRLVQYGESLQSNELKFS